MIGKWSRAWPAVVSLGASAVALGAGPDAGGVAFFEKKIRPVLVESCYECHSAEADEKKGGLLLDSREGVLKGGDSGPALVPGKADESLILVALSHKDRDLEMPPKKRLPDAVIADFKKWVELGAPDPREGGTVPESAQKEIDIAEGRKIWSFQPVVKRGAPEVSDDGWPRGEIDRFLLARMEEEGLRPAPDAPPEALLRRVYYDLTGLPPAVEEIDAFVADPSREAFEAVVDKLLDSPEFGERWGRHWLDIVRYADSSGGGRAIPHPDAWRFRDYVIRSFEDDKPLDQLIREHLAGDLLEHATPEEEAEHLTAVGFLAMGPTNYELQDKELLDLEIVDEQLDTMGRAFLGMTIGCARCHDHKFDPIPTRDYYAMAGVFTSTRTVNHSNVSNWVKRTLPASADLREVVEKNRAEVAALEGRLKELGEKLKAAGGEVPTQGRKPAAVAELVGLVIDNVGAELVGEWMESTSNPRWVEAGYIHDMTMGKGAKSVTFRPKFEKAGTYEVRIAYSNGTNRSVKVPVTVGHRDGETTKKINQKQKPGIDDLFVSVGKFTFEAGEKAYVQISNQGTEDGVVIADAVQFIPEGGAKVAKGGESAKVEKREEKGASEAEIKALRAEIDKLKKAVGAAKKRAPKLPSVMGVEDLPKGADTPIRIRGVVRNEGEVVPRGVLSVTVDDGEGRLPIEKGSGRREFAEWVTDVENPLTSRVMANRIWLHLFGDGIVRTPDNFGETGEAPSHPELLDYLAARLVGGGWSTKVLIREIVLSRAYGIDSLGGDPDIATKDPRNLLLAKAHRRRLGAEAIRDTMLLLGGELDRTRFGAALPNGFKSEFGYKFKTKRRSIYAPVFRNTEHEILAVFDFANPNFVMGRRTSSNIPTQALYLMNSQFVNEVAAAAAKELLSLPAADDGARVRVAFRRALGRPPTSSELEMGEKFLAEEVAAGSTPEVAWAAFQKALIGSLDFRYLR